MNKHQEEGWQLFLHLCTSMKDYQELSSLFELLMTAEEKANLATRILIIKALLAGNMTQRDMAKDMNVSIAKITRGSNELKRMPKELIKIIKARLA